MKYSRLAIIPCRLRRKGVLKKLRGRERNITDSKSNFIIALLEPTSPMRTFEIVKQTIDVIEDTEFDAALTLSPVQPSYHPDKQFTINQKSNAKFFTSNGHTIKSRQQLSTTYIRNGFCYAIRSDSINKGSDIFGFNLYGVVCNIPYVNIDKPEDLALCRKLL